MDHFDAYRRHTEWVASVWEAFESRLPDGVRLLQIQVPEYTIGVHCLSRQVTAWIVADKDGPAIGPETERLFNDTVKLTMELGRIAEMKAGFRLVERFATPVPDRPTLRLVLVKRN